jgi:hypothetical protein
MNTGSLDIGSLAVTLGQAGATVLGGALGGPAGAAIAPRIVGILAEAFGVSQTPEAVEKAVKENPEAGLIIARAEAQHGPAISEELADLLAAEEKRASQAQSAEIERGFTTWQIQRAAIQGVVWGIWLAIAVAGIFGGNIGVRPLIPLGDMISAWSTVTMIWMIVFHGGHTVKEVIGPGALASLLSRGKAK